MNIYVGNLSFNTDAESLRTAFGEFGEVTSADVITDRETGRSRGFGFVEMADKSEAETAIKELNGKELDGRILNVNEARPKADRNSGGGGDRGGRGGRGGDRGGRRW